MKGATALVLGASSGIGAAVAERLGKAQATVALCARRAHLLDGVQALVEAAGGTCVTRACDLSEPGTAADAVAWARERMGSLDIVVYSAGIARLAPLHQVRPSTWEKVIRLNTLAVAELAAAVIPLMRERQRGWFIVMGSAVALTPLPGTGAYGVSKAATHHLVSTLDAENRAHGVHAYVVCPGWVRTALAADPKELGVDARRLLDPDDVAATVHWLVSQPDHVRLGPVIEVQASAPDADAAASIQKFIESRGSR